MCFLLMERIIFTFRKGFDMLSAKIVQGKSHDEVMEEVLSKIPIYSEEWTNYNPSDPGITILEYLSAFQILQQEQMDIVSDPVKYKLLALAGYTPRRSSGAKVYIEPKGLERDIAIPADQRFMVGDISFETTLARDMTSARIKGVYLKSEDKITSLVNCIIRDMYVDTYAFTDKPKPGMELYIVMDKPVAPGQEAIISIETNPMYRRNPDGDSNMSQLTWEYYTAAGFQTLEVVDETNGFLVDGIIRTVMPEVPGAHYKDNEIDGYVWRVTLNQANYDLAPSIRYISGFLFPVVQKETLVIAHSFQKAQSVELNCAMLEDNYIKVYCKEEKGSSYRLYQHAPEERDTGRYYTKERLAYGQYVFRFDKRKYGFAPANVKNAIKIIIYNEEMMRKYYLGDVYGYDNQEVVLPKQHVMTETFALMAERTDENGEKIYDFVRPGKMSEQQFSYSLLENEGKIVITDAGDYIGAKLYLASIAITLGSEGNVRAGNIFKPYGFDEDVVFTNPVAGVGGAFKEKLEDVRRRFVADLNEPYTAVLESDYERLVKRTPGLCISKVHAWMDMDKNEVQIAVLPISQDKQPKLSEAYRKSILTWIDDKRLLSTRINVCQPRYSSVITSGTIYVKPHFEKAREQIENVINDHLDYIRGNQKFGEVLCFEKLFHALESLECVAYIHDLNIVPQKSNYARIEGSDIRPMDDCLLIPGQIKVDIITAKESTR